MEIRELFEADADAWWQIRMEALRHEPFAFGKSAEEHRNTPVETIASRFREARSSGNFNAGAFDGGDLVGIATFAREPGLKERHKGHIYGVYVKPSYRGKGIARALLTYLLGAAKEDPSLEQILLAVTTCQQAARQLYRSFGFEVYGTEPRALKAGSTYLDEDQMILRVRQQA